MAQEDRTPYNATYTADINVDVNAFVSTLRLVKKTALGEVKFTAEESALVDSLCAQLNEKARVVLGTAFSVPVRPADFMAMQYFYGLTPLDAVGFFRRQLDSLADVLHGNKRPEAPAPPVEPVEIKDHA